MKQRGNALSSERGFMDTESGFMDAFESVVHSDFPNPHRIGCPGNHALARFAAQPEDPQFAALSAHIRQCAPCFEELKELRRNRT